MWWSCHCVLQGCFPFTINVAHVVHHLGAPYRQLSVTLGAIFSPLGPAHPALQRHPPRGENRPNPMGGWPERDDAHHDIHHHHLYLILFSHSDHIPAGGWYSFPLLTLQAVAGGREGPAGSDGCSEASCFDCSQLRRRCRRRSAASSSNGGHSPALGAFLLKAGPCPSRGRSHWRAHGP